MPLYAMRYRMCRVGKVDFELMEPVGEEGVISKFLNSRGEGIHHVAFAVEEATPIKERLVAAGATPVSDSVLEDGTRLVMLRDPWGVALQLVQRAVPLA